MQEQSGDFFKNPQIIKIEENFIVLLFLEI